MISLFRKHIAPRFASTGFLAILFVLSTGFAAQGQVATRTQLSTEQGAAGIRTYTAKVADVGGAPVSEGSVSFETAKGSLGSVFVHGGTATLNLKNAPEWATTVTAVYHGDADFSSSAGSAEATTEASGLPGFTVTATPSSLTLTPGQYGTVELAITSQNGFSEQVNLSCSGLPGTAFCNFNPVVATPPGNGSINSAMQITTMATSGAPADPSSSLRRSGGVYAVVIPGLLALAGVGTVRRKNLGALKVLGLMMLLGAGTLGLSACSQRYRYLNYQPSPNYGTAPGTYTVVVAAYSSNGTSITQATSSDSGCSGAVCLALTVQ